MTSVVSRRRILVLYDRSRDAAGALRQAAKLTRAHASSLTVVALAGHETKAIGCSVGADAWNREMSLLADQELATASGILQHEHLTAHLMVADGAGAAGLAAVARTMGADLVVVPGRGIAGRRFARAIRKRTCAEVLVVSERR